MNKNMPMYPRLKSTVFATDLDNTIVSESIPHQPLWESISLEETSLIYITGRHFESAMRLIDQEQLPLPTILICDVGASIYVGPFFLLDRHWMKHVHRTDYTKVKELAKSLQMTPQPIPSPWRLAYYANETKVKQLEKAVNENNLAIHIIFSSNRDVDILPKDVDKGAALEYVLRASQHEGEVIVAGDSENDISLFELGYPAIAVGNACESIRNLVNREHIHFATKNAGAGVQEIWEKLKRN